MDLGELYVMNWVILFLDNISPRILSSLIGGYKTGKEKLSSYLVILVTYMFFLFILKLSNFLFVNADIICLILSERKFIKITPSVLLFIPE